MPLNRTAVINLVGLSDALIGDLMPRVRDFAARGACATIHPAFPGVTCTAQSTYLTGSRPSAHGIVGNGWYNRELAEVQFWKQSHHLVHGPTLWEELRRQHASFTCAKLFWWHNMYSTADYSITPRPMYPADGRKIFDIYTWPYSIRPEIKQDLGEFPFPCFWGPGAGADSPQGPPDAASRWIAESAKWIEKKYQPSMSLIYLPHLDYNLQRHGPFAASVAGAGPQAEPASPNPQNPGSPGGRRPGINPQVAPDLGRIDSIAGDLIDFFKARGVRVAILSEYGMTNAGRPISLNRLFRRQGWLAIKEELGLELLDCGASKVFAVADHQVAHVYLNDPSLENAARALLEAEEGVASVLGAKEKAAAGIDHPRAGDLIAVARENAWFTYYYWLDDARAPDFARTVDIHRKPGYDPVELFLDPGIPLVKLRIAWRLLRKKLGFRMLMDVIPLDAALVKGSHGCLPASRADWPVLIVDSKAVIPGGMIDSTEVFQVLKRLVLE